MKRRAPTALQLCVWVALVAGSAIADGAEPPSAVAKQHFERGAALLGESRWTEAIGELEKARAIYPTAPIHFNLGLAYRGAGRAREAIASFERYRRAVGDSADPLRQAEVNRYLATLRASLGQLQLDVWPAEAAVMVDQEPARSTGLVELNPGVHTVSVTAEGYVPVTRQITLSPGTTVQLQLRLVAITKRAQLQLAVQVPTANLRVDGVIVGNGHALVTLDAGQHVVEVEAASYKPLRREVSLSAGARQELSLTLERKPRVGGWVALGVIGLAAIAAGTTVGIVLGVKEQSPIVPPLGVVSTGLKVATW